MWKRKKLLISAVVLVVILLTVMVSMRNGGEKGIKVQTARVERTKIVQTVTATGRIQPKTQVKISADVGAKITYLAVKEGDWVEKGSLLVRLDREKFQAAVESAEANLRSFEANANLARENMNKAEKDYKRLKGLFDNNLESQATLDQTSATYQVERARYQSALDQVEQARATLKQAQDDLSKTTIYAPMTGTISQLNKEVGEIALGSQFQEDVIMVVSNLSGMEALVNVDENDIVSVSVGDSARIEVDALPDHEFIGVVSEIANSARISAEGSADQKTEFEVKIGIENPGDFLRPGMTASSDITTETHKNVLGIPIQSVGVRTPEQLKKKSKAGKPEGEVAIADEKETEQYVPDKEGFVEVVFVLQADGTVRARQVKTGIQSETHIEIEEGLNDGEEIVIGNYRAISQDLENGSLVSVEREELASR